MHQIFVLQPYARVAQSVPLAVITPVPVEQATVIAAWAYAVRYTAKGLDLPDYEQAKQLLIERHPSWTVIESKVVNVPVNLEFAENDKPE